MLTTINLEAIEVIDFRASIFKNFELEMLEDVWQRRNVRGWEHLG